MFKEWIEYENSKTLEEAMRKENLCYDQKKNKRENIISWKNKRPNNFDPKKKQNKFHKNLKKTIGDTGVIFTKNLNPKTMQ